MNKLFVLLVLVAGFFATGCPNYATLQEADTLPKGTGKTGVGITATQYKIDLGDPEPASVTVPALNVWYRRGLTEKLEAHASVWIPLGSSLGVKYQLMGNRNTAGLSMSLGLDLGYLQISAENDMDVTVKQTFLDTYVPIYLGYRTGPGFATYLSPKYIFRTVTGGGETAFGHLAGGTLGIALGAKTTLHLEGSFMYDITLKEPIVNGGIGVAF